MNHPTAHLRLLVRVWALLARWTEKRLVSSYDRLVDAEQRP